MCFNRFLRVSKQLNGMWHQLHFFSCISGGGGGGDVSTSSPNEIGDDIGVASMILEESWTDAWVWRLTLCCWLLFSSLSSSFTFAARKDCLIIFIFKDLFSRLKIKTCKNIYSILHPLNELWVKWKKLYGSPKIIILLQKVRVPHFFLRELCRTYVLFPGVIFPQHLLKDFSRST